MRSAVRRSAVDTCYGESLAPIQPSLRLDEISERARLRAKAAKLIRQDRLSIVAHQRMMSWLDHRELCA